ncbi:hypothetical protein RJ641_032705 [Dillenia turbinata]|uniref:Protein FLC EXPRESSOR n=1 Tax=Dillenia turbinata TaxID=194707 RepID=A0AAN8VKD2_9MAGN
MAGRNRFPSDAMKLREAATGTPLFPADTALIEELRNPRPPLFQHPPLVEDRLVAQHREIQTRLLDNQRLAATHVALKQELAAAHQELRHLSAAAATVKAERDADVRDVYERSLKMDAEVRSIDALRAELAQVRSDVQKLTAAKDELTAELQENESELARVRAELKSFQEIQAEIEGLRQELQRGRAAVAYEKRTQSANLKQGRQMEKNMGYMVREMEKLRAELANVEKRARAAAAAAAAANPNSIYETGDGYGTSYGNPETGYAGNPYPDPYLMHQVQSAADPGPLFRPAAMANGSNKQLTASRC